jgi:tetratricopeptide (TPR) repeat protein
MNSFAHSNAAALNETYGTFDKQHFHENIHSLWQPTLKKFHSILITRFTFEMIFLMIGCAEIVLFCAFFALLQKSTLLAFGLAVLFLTLFSYFVIRLYFQAKKPEQFSTIKDEFLESCKRLINYQEGVPEHHIALANATCKLAAHLHDQEYSYYTPPEWLRGLRPLLEKFSCWCFWKDLFTLKELLLNSAVEEHIKVVKVEPTHLEVHAALANAYVTLSSLYADPRKFEGYDEERWISKERLSDSMQLRYRLIAERAIEEFKILKEYSPQDPWVHLQLAYSYHDLQMPEEEIKEYEAILTLKPEDVDTLFKLGMLYFQQGQNAKGLQAYQTLKHRHPKKADHLIKFYGAYTPVDEFSF